MRALPVFLCSQTSLKYETEHCWWSGKTINWSADSFQINHVASMSWHMSPRYGHGILVSGYPVMTAVNWPYCEFIVNVLYKRCGLAKTRLRHPSLPFDSLPTPPVQSVDAYVRTYARSITWQPKEKRLTIIYGYGALSHAISIIGKHTRRCMSQTFGKIVYVNYEQ